MWATGKNSVGIPGKLLKAGTVTARGLSPVIMCPSTPAGGASPLLVSLDQVSSSSTCSPCDLISSQDPMATQCHLYVSADHATCDPASCARPRWSKTLTLTWVHQPSLGRHVSRTCGLHFPVASPEDHWKPRATVHWSTAVMWSYPVTFSPRSSLFRVC